MCRYNVSWSSQVIHVLIYAHYIILTRYWNIKLVRLVLCMCVCFGSMDAMLICWEMFWEINMLNGSLFEYLACCIHLYVFFLPWKTPFLQGRQLLEKYLDTSFSIEPLCFALDRFSTSGQYIELFFWPLFLLNRSSTHSRSIEISRFLLDNTSTASQSIEMISLSFCLLDTFSTNPWSIETIL